MADLYRQLDSSAREIRLVTVEAGRRDDINCELKTVSLDGELPQYESVSYCWGDTTKKCTINVDDQTMDVSKNAHAALMRIRDPTIDRTIWMDAICINQADVEERGSQVSNMHLVYHRATRNLIWLGEDDGLVAPALETMRIILDEARLETDNFRTFFEEVYDDAGHIPPSLSGFMSHFEVETFLKLLARPWFQRLWVVQEAALSPFNVGYCGPHEFPMLDLFRAAAFLYSKRNHMLCDLRSHAGLFNAATVGELADPEHGPERRNLGETDKVKLSSLLRKLQRFQTLDPRDHVYGVLGLYRHYLPRRRLPILIEPDYNKNVIEVLRDGTKYTILDQQSLDSLNKVSHWPDEDDDFPSWIPRWHRKWNSEKDPSGLVTYFDASKNTSAQIVMSRFGGLNTLILKGLFPGNKSDATITIISGSYSRPDHAPTLLAEAKAMISQQKNITHIYPDIPTAMATALLANRSLESKPLSKQDIAGLTAFQDYIDTTAPVPPPPIRALNALSQISEPLTWRASRFLSAFLASV
ncbi:hypothetical protein AC578_4149 [Pseudocercospora eumusae]|uniref:Heterokaryon incompatibility domain-containing protein n=1 Tax=Pseudocercospora eumusae TaxID=321146 RepID=A0A139GWD1_9PEZI|nr:hypothetical protein AC578_4149 [Pseudocercospora eumusae]